MGCKYLPRIIGVLVGVGAGEGGADEAGDEDDGGGGGTHFERWCERLIDLFSGRSKKERGDCACGLVGLD